MKLRKIDSLKQSLINNKSFFPRKKEDQLCLLVNTENKEIYAVPVEEEHISCALRILNTSIDELIEKGSILVPSNIRLNIYEHPNFVYSLVIGVSGLEMRYGVRHTKKQIDRAHELMYNFLRKGEFNINLSEDKRIYRFCKDE